MYLVSYHKVKASKCEKKTPKLNLSKSEFSRQWICQQLFWMYFLWEWDWLNFSTKGLVPNVCISAELGRRGPDSLLGWWTYLHWLNQNCAFICVLDPSTLLRQSWLFVSLPSTAFSYRNNICPIWRHVCSTKTSEGKILTVLPLQT